MDPEVRTFMRNLQENFHETWNAIGEGLQNQILTASFKYLSAGYDHSDSDYHQRIYAMVQGILQNLIPQSGNSAVWIVLGNIGQLLGRPSSQLLVNDCIYMLLKNMTTGVQLDQVSLNISFYEHLDVDSAVKQPGIGLFALLGLHMPLLWPICCCQLQRLMDEEDGLLIAIKLLIGMLDFRHCGDFIKKRTQECDVLVANIIERAGNITAMSPYVNWIQQAYTRDTTG